MRILFGKVLEMLLPFLMTVNVGSTPVTVTNYLDTVSNNSRYSDQHQNHSVLTDITTTKLNTTIVNHKGASTMKPAATQPSEEHSLHKARSRIAQTSSCDSQIVAERSICPWSNDVFTEIPERSPSIFYEARCLSNTPIGLVDSNIRCVQVMVTFHVNYKDRNSTVEERHAVGCTPVLPCRK